MHLDLNNKLKEQLGATVAGLVPQEMQPAGGDLATIAGNNIEGYGERLAHALRLLEGHVPKNRPLLDDEKMENLVAEIDSGRPLQDILNITDERFLDIYEIASKLENDEHHSDASDLFLFLCILQPQVGPCWKALGITEEHLQRWDEAIGAFGVAIALEPKDVECWIGMARGLVHSQKQNEAMDVLASAKEHCDKSDHSKIDAYKALVK